MVPVDQTSSQGSDVILECTAPQGGPSNTFQWLNSSGSVVSTTSTLTLTNVMAADGGTYTCMVTNDGGTNSATTSVLISPYFTSQPQAVGGDSGTMVTLTCEAEAFPSPVYQWSRTDGGTIGTTATGQASSTLVFSPLQFGDEGDYLCNATSSGVTIQSAPATLSGKTPQLSRRTQINFHLLSNQISPCSDSSGHGYS